MNTELEQLTARLARMEQERRQDRAELSRATRRARLSTACALAALALTGLLAAHPAAAQQNAYFTSGASTINYAITGGAFVGEDSSGNTTNPNTGQPYNANVTLASGGSVFVIV